MNLIKLAAFAVFSVGMSLSVYPMEISKARNYTREFPVGISSTKLTDMLKSSTASLAETDIIADPEGIMTVYSRSSIAIAPIGETAGETVDCGFAGIIVTGGNGDVYMKNPFSQFPTDTYIKGHVDGTKMTFDFPQNFASIEEDGEEYELYACLLEFSADGMSMELSADQTLTFAKEGESWVMEEEALLGLTLNDLDEYVWSGFGERDMRFEPLNAVAATIPDNATIEDWSLIYSGIGHYVKMAFEGDKCYIGDFFTSESGESLAPIVGTKTADGIVFPSGQYLGINDDDSYLTYFYAVNVELAYDESIAGFVTSFDPVDNLVFTLDADGSYSCQTSALFTPFTDLKSEYLWYEDLYETPVLRKSDVGDFTPAAPSISAYRYYDSMGFGYVTFDIPALNADGMLLDTEKLYYNIYINDAKFTLNPNDYLMLDEEITDIPYLFTDAHDGMSGDITIEGQKHTFILFDEGIEAVGVQSFYVDNGKTYYSPLVNNKVTGIDDAAIDNSPVVEETYTDLAGRSVTDPGHGLYIKTVRRADGSVESFKIVK